MLVASVRSISEECNRMLTIANNVDDSFKIYELAKELESEKNKMVSLYESEDYDETLVDGQKKVVCKVALELEELLVPYDKDIEKRFVDRSRIRSLYEAVVDEASNASKGVIDSKSLLLVFVALHKMKEIYDKTSEIIYALDDDDKLNLQFVRTVV